MTTPAAGGNPFSNPITLGEEGARPPSPRPRDIEGSLVFYVPVSITRAGEPGNTEGVGGSAPRDRVTADLIILESPGEFLYGGSPEYERDPKPHTHRGLGPMRFERVWISNTNLVRFALAPDGVLRTGELVLGRISRSQIGNRPFNLDKVDGTPDLAKAIDLWARLQMGALAFNQGVPLFPQAAPAPANTVSYAQAPPMPPMPPAQPVSAPMSPAAVQYPQPVPVPPAVAQMWPQAAPVAVPVPPVPQPPVPVPPAAPFTFPLTPSLVQAGWTDASWATLTPEQKAQVYAATPQ